MTSSDIHLTANSQEITQPSIDKFNFKITHVKFHSNLPEANELRENVISLQNSSLFLLLTYVLLRMLLKQLTCWGLVTQISLFKLAPQLPGPMIANTSCDISFK